MGYDMYWKNPEAGEAEAVEAAREAFYAAARDRDALPEEEKGTFNRPRAEELGDWDAHEAYDGRSDRYQEAQDKVHAAFEAMHAAEASYFRLNIFGMARYREAMHQLGMVFDAGGHPPFPDAEDYGLTWEEYYEFQDPSESKPGEVSTLTQDKREAAAKLTAEADRVRAWHGPEIPGIPAHKFGSNDGWHVLPAECKAALDIYQRQLEQLGEDGVHALLERLEIDRGLWGRWVAYLNGAISHGGFKVH